MKEQFTVDPAGAFEEYYLKNWEELPNYDDVSVVVQKNIYQAGYLEGVQEALKQLHKKGAI